MNARLRHQHISTTWPASRPFLVCVHDATPAYARETGAIVRDLGPLIGRRVSFGVVPNWHGHWPLPAHRDYCRLLRENSEELLLHGYYHQRLRGWGPVTWLAERSDEMSGLNEAETRLTLERAQSIFTEVFDFPARGFLAPAWQAGHVRSGRENLNGSITFDHVLGFFSLDARAGAKVSLATWSWHCGRWGWLGHIGHGLGGLLQSTGRRVPVVAIHPRDLAHGFWPRILRLIQELVHNGFQPHTAAGLLEARCVEVDP